MIRKEQENPSQQTHEIADISHHSLIQSLCDQVLTGNLENAQCLAGQLRRPQSRRCARPHEVRVQAWFDGSCWPNPGGHTGYGAVVKRDGQIIFSAVEYLGQGAQLSNNVAEYAGIIAVFRYLVQERIEWADVYGDSQMVIKQLQGTIKAKHGLYLPYYREARELRAKLPDMRLV